MTMTKKEKAEVDRLIAEIRLVGALRWTTAVPPDVAIPKDMSMSIVNGWLFNGYNGTVSKACTSTVHHSYGNWDKTTTQGPRELYSTKLLALRACRHEVERESAKKLAAIDLLIEEEMNNG